MKSPIERKVIAVEAPWLLLEEVINRGSTTFPKEDLKTAYDCIQCGECVGGCPSGRRTGWHVRSTIRKMQLGLREELLNSDEIWLCTTCYTCQERCPRQLMITDLVRTIRNIAFEQGHAKDSHLKIAKNMLELGHTVPPTEEMKKMRERLGLNALPPTALQFPEALSEVKKLAEATGFSNKVSKAK